MLKTHTVYILQNKFDTREQAIFTRDLALSDAGIEKKNDILVCLISRTQRVKIYIRFIRAMATAEGVEGVSIPGPLPSVR
ncbi:hypothetical protein EON65_21390 [archaeon]|nr:MAG: hypothetical protein EON65_21390 [archaeon]